MIDAALSGEQILANAEHGPVEWSCLDEPAAWEVMGWVAKHIDLARFMVARERRCVIVTPLEGRSRLEDWSDDALDAPGSGISFLSAAGDRVYIARIVDPSEQFMVRVVTTEFATLRHDGTEWVCTSCVLGQARSDTWKAALRKVMTGV